MNFKLLIISMFLVVAFQNNVKADGNYQLNTSGSKLIISGTSSIHDWEMVANSFECTTTLKVANNSIEEIGAIKFLCQSGEVKSHNKIMDKKAWKALDKDNHPEISFSLEPGKITEVSKGEASFTGKLVIAGKTKTVEVDCNLKLNDLGSVLVSGEIPLKMSDFGIKPPTAMMGALKTGDDITIKYEFDFSPIENSEESALKQ